MNKHDGGVSVSKLGRVSNVQYNVRHLVDDIVIVLEAKGSQVIERVIKHERYIRSRVLRYFPQASGQITRD